MPSRGRTLRAWCLPAPSPVPLSESSYLPCPGAPHPHPSPCRRAQPAGLSWAKASSKEVFCVPQEPFCLFSSYFELTLCLPVSRKAPFFLGALFACRLRLGESHGPPPPTMGQSQTLRPPLGVSTPAPALTGLPSSGIMGCFCCYPLFFSFIDSTAVGRSLRTHTYSINFLLSPVSVLSACLICLSGFFCLFVFGLSQAERFRLPLAGWG